MLRIPHKQDWRYLFYNKKSGRERFDWANEEAPLAVKKYILTKPQVFKRQYLINLERKSWNIYIFAFALPWNLLISNTAGTKRWNNDVSMLIQRHDVRSTSIKRCLSILYLLDTNLWRAFLSIRQSKAAITMIRNDKTKCPSEDSYQLGHPLSLISISDVAIEIA